MAAPDPLHDTLRDLHALERTPSDELPAVLERAVSDLVALLDLRSPTALVTITTSAFAKLRLWYHTAPAKRTPAAPHLPRLLRTATDRALRRAPTAPLSICKYVSDNVPDVSSATVYSQLIELLAEPCTRRPVRIRDGYSALVAHLSRLILHYVHLDAAADTALLEFWSNCFALEQAYYADLQSNFDAPPDADTQKIINALDNYVDKPSEQTTALLDSMFSYEYTDRLPVAAVAFSSSDASLNRLYFNFLQLALLKPKELFPERSAAYLKVMLGLYKKSLGVDRLEIDGINSFDVKRALLEDYFCAQDGPPMLPSNAQKLVRDALDNAAAITAPPRSPDVLPASFSSQIDENTSAREFLTADALNLISEVSAVCDSLRECGLALEPHFPDVFHQYLVFVYEQLPDAASEHDFAYIRSVADTIRAIIDYRRDDSDGLLAILHDLGRAHHLLVSVSAQQSILMRAAALVTFRTRSMLVHALRGWNLRFLARRHMDVCERNWVRRRLLKWTFSAWYVRMSRQQELQKHAAIYNDRQLLTYALNERFVRPLLRITEKEQTADLHFCRRHFARWKCQHTMRAAKAAHVTARVDKTTRRIFFARLCFVFTQNEHKRALALQHCVQTTSSKERELARRVLVHWRHHLGARCFPDAGENEVPHILRKLDRRAREFALGRPFTRWIVQQKRANALDAFRAAQKRLLLRLFVSRWTAAHNLVKHEHAYAAHQHSILKCAVLTYWHTHCANHQLADRVHRRRLLFKYLRQLQLVAATRRVRQASSTRVVRTCFRKWALEAAAGLHVSQAEGLFRTWTRRTKQLQKWAVHANDRWVTTAKRRALLYWWDATQALAAGRVVADLNVQRCLLNRWSRKVHFNRTQERLAEETRVKARRARDDALVRTAWNAWHSRYRARFEHKSQALVRRFRHHATQRVMLQVFRNWRQRWRRLEVAQNRWHSQVVACQRQSTIVRAALALWIDSTNERFDSVARADAVYVGRVQGKTWRAWTLKYLWVAFHMTTQADNMADRRDYESAVALLRKWYYKYATVVSATDNICTKFVEKKKRLNLKIMFELWVHKHHAKHAPRTDASVDEGNFSFGSNASPLARKNASAAAASFLDYDTYFYTPLGASSPITPVKKYVSPTRLQETNQRVRLSRMDALTRRFREAGISDDVGRGSLRARSVPRLLPPRRTSRTAALTQPPPAPNFDDFRAQDQEDTYDEEVSIDTAKSLQRIRPIVIPFDESPGGLRYSTVTTLKDRLQSVQTSPKRRVADVASLPRGDDREGRYQ